MTGKSVCQFFLQGRCKYGNNCWNAHTNPGDNFGNSNNNNGPFGGKQNNVFGGGGFGNKNNPFNRNQGKQTPTIKDMTTPQIIEHIKTEMITWENGKMWPFSCFAISKELPTFPELEDMSPEELRFEAYEARGSNNFPAFQQKFNTLVSEFTKKRNQLKNPDQTVKQNLAKVIESQLRTLNSTNQSLGGRGGSGSNIFGQTTFGQSSMQTPSNSSNMFGSTSNNTSSTFGQSGNSFMKPAASAGGFGQPSAFGALNNNSSNTGFNSSPNTFGSNPQQPVQSIQQPQNMQLLQNQNQFQQKLQPNQTFGGLMSSPGTGNTNQPNPTQFGAIAQSNQNPAPPVPPTSDDSDSIYSKISDLNPDELKEFQAVEFNLNSIPLKPPPKELCQQVEIKSKPAFSLFSK